MFGEEPDISEDTYDDVILLMRAANIVVAAPLKDDRMVVYEISSVGPIIIIS